ALIRFPFVEPAVAVAVFFGAHERAFLIVFDAIDPAVPFRRDLDALDRAGRIEIRPRIFDAVLRAGEADFFQTTVGAVVLPAIDLAVLVPVDFDAQDPRAVHVAECVEPAVAIGVVAQQFQAAGLLVIGGLDFPAPAGRGPATGAADRAY